MLITIVKSILAPAFRKLHADDYLLIAVCRLRISRIPAFFRCYVETQPAFR